MPLLEFECKNENCPTKIFEKLVNDRNTKSTSCPNCGSRCYRVVASLFGIGTQNQYQNIDRIVGQDAERKWKLYYERKEQREKLIKEGVLKRPKKVYVSSVKDNSFMNPG